MEVHIEIRPDKEYEQEELLSVSCDIRLATKSKSPFKCILPTLSLLIDVYGDH